VNIKRSKKFIILPLIVAVMLLCMPLTAQASDSTEVPDTSRTCMLNFVAAYTRDSGATKKVSGMQVTIYRVASMDRSGVSLEYRLISRLSGTGVNVNKINTAAANLKAAGTLSKAVRSDNIAGITKVTGADGRASFGGLKTGLYLIVETKASGTASKYSVFQSYLLSMPEHLATSTSSTWNYQVTVKPKILPKHNGHGSNNPPDNKHNPGNPHGSLVKTGDYSDIQLYLGLLGASLLALVCLCLLKRRENRNSD
jgi:hypothetical protein